MISLQDYFSGDYFCGPFAALNEHLKEVFPTMSSFGQRFGFEFNRTSRYPRLRLRSGVQEVGSLHSLINLEMEGDENGKRRESFVPDSPYRLCISTEVFLPTPRDHIKLTHFSVPNGFVRFSRCQLCFSGIPFSRVPSILEAEMLKALDTLQRWDIEDLVQNGEQSAFDEYCRVIENQID